MVPRSFRDHPITATLLALSIAASAAGLLASGRWLSPRFSDQGSLLFFTGIALNPEFQRGFRTVAPRRLGATTWCERCNATLAVIRRTSLVDGVALRRSTVDGASSDKGQ